MSRTRPERLFVYGSLKPGGANIAQLEGVGGRWREARVRGRFYDDDWAAGSGYPALILDETAGAIDGYLLESPKLAGRWARLDAFEGAAYRRVIASVTLDDGTRTDAWVYVSSRASPTA